MGLTNTSFSYGKKETTTSFVYDSTGARVKKTAGSTATVYLGKDYEITGSTTTKHIFLGDRRITTKKSTGEISFIHDDHISSSNVVTDASGNQSALYEYDPYGATVTHTGIDLKHQFTGQEKDDSTGLHYYNARYYDSQLGRFITSDPTVQNVFDPQDLNRYAYARNNPIIFTDPSGLGFFKKFFAFLGAVIGAAIGNMLLPGAGFFIGAIIGGALGGALGGTIDAAIEGKSLQQGAISGAIYGAITGALYAAGSNGDERAKEKTTNWINSFFKSSEVEIQEITIQASQQLGAARIHFSEYATMGIYAAGIPSLSQNGEFSYASSYRADQKIVHFVGAAAAAYYILQFALFRTLAPTAAVLSSNQLGRMGERMAGISQSAKVRIPSMTGTASYRIPDELTATMLREVKYAMRVSYTPQLQDFLLYARSKGLIFVLETRPDTILARGLQELVKRGEIIHKIIDALQKVS